MNLVGIRMLYAKGKKIEMSRKLFALLMLRKLKTPSAYGLKHLPLTLTLHNMAG